MRKGYWTYDKCKEIALICKTKKEFSEYNKQAYKASYKHKWIDDICSHMSGNKKRIYGWTKELCIQEALKYGGRFEFKKLNRSAYDQAYKNNWLDDICQHMKYPQKIKIKKWTKELCIIEANKYKTKSDFNINSCGAYLKSSRNGWLEEVCSHMEVRGSLLKRLVYVYEYPNKSAYIGLTCNENKRNSQHSKLDETSPVFKYNKESGLIPIKKIISEGYIYVGCAQQLEVETLEKYKLNGWKILNKSKAGGLGGNIIKWDKKACTEVALKCTTKKEFIKLYGSAYQSACKNGWLNDICKHMIILQKPNGYWDYNKCKDAAKYCGSKTELRSKYSGAYTASLKNEWLNEFIPQKIHKKQTELV